MATAALDDHDFAQPAGEDEFGEVFQTSSVPSAMWEFLDEDGEYELASFVGQTIMRDQEECRFTDQAPLAGTIYNCPQMFDVALYYTCDDNNQYMAMLEITLIDIDPPVIAVDLVSGDTPHLSFGGVLRYPATASVLPVIDITDPCGVNAEYLLNGDPYTPNTPISGTGLYFLNIIAEDDSENLSAASIVFEIRERPSYTGAAVVKQTNCTFDNDELTSISVRLVVAAEQFGPEEILGSSLRMIVRDPNGDFVALQPMQMSVVEINDCWTDVELEVDANSPGMPFYPWEFSECPSEVYILGVGLVDSQIGFEWGAIAANVADPNAIDTLAALANFEVTACADPGEPKPDPCDDRACVAVVTPILAPNQSCDLWGPASSPPPCENIWMSAAKASPKSVSGGSRAFAMSGPPDGTVCQSTSAVCEVSANGVIVATFAGDCCECSLSFNATASLTATVFVGGMGAWEGTGTSKGRVHFLTPCGDAVAAVNLTLSANQDTGDPNGILQTQSDSGAVECDVLGCGGGVLVLSAWGSVNTQARATWWVNVGPSNAETIARLRTTGSSANVTGSGDTCPCE